MKPVGMPASAATSAASSAPASWASGLIVQNVSESGGRARSAVSPPASASAISTATAASCGCITDSVWTCFVVMLRAAASSRSARVSGATSWAETGIQMNPTSGSSSATRQIAVTSSRPERRRSPVAGSATSTPQPSVAAQTWWPSSGRSRSGSRPASVNVAGALRRAASMTCPGTRTIPVDGSTCAPCAAQIAWARADGKRTPTVSMSSSVAAWMRSSAAGSSTWSRIAGSTSVARGRRLGAVDGPTRFVEDVMAGGITRPRRRGVALCRRPRSRPPRTRPRRSPRPMLV